MSVAPFAVKKLIPAGPNDPPINPRIGILHVDAGNAESLYDWFNGPSGGIESHGFITLDGSLEQYRSTGREADANYLANPFATSWETQGFGEGKWTDEQLAMIKRVMRWEHKADGIPLRVAQSWDDRKGGWGYHTMFPQWTNVAGKTCPGRQRIIQFNRILVPWLKAGGQEERRPTPNITAALTAKDPAERKRALRKIIRHGDDDAANVAARWLSVLNRLEDARDLSRELRMNLKDFEIK